MSIGRSMGGPGSAGQRIRPFAAAGACGHGLVHRRDRRRLLHRTTAWVRADVHTARLALWRPRAALHAMLSSGNVTRAVTLTFGGLIKNRARPSRSPVPTRPPTASASQRWWTRTSPRRSTACHWGRSPSLGAPTDSQCRAPSGSRTRRRRRALPYSPARPPSRLPHRPHRGRQGISQPRHIRPLTWPRSGPSPCRYGGLASFSSPSGGSSDRIQRGGCRGRR